MNIREAIEEDIVSCGRVIFAAFKAVAERHGFPPDFPSAEAAAGLAAALLSNPTVVGLVAETEGRIVGCNFIDLSQPAAGLGPIAVLPETQAGGVGRLLMQAALDCAAANGPSGVRLNQSAYNTASLSLYTKLGFHARAPISVIQGPPPALQTETHRVRALQEADIPACERLCRKVLGFERTGEVRSSIARETAMVVEMDKCVVGYTTGIGFIGHAVTLDDEGLKALICAAPSYPGPGFLLPTSNHSVLQWCLERGLWLVMQMTYMSTGFYGEPNGSWLPSVMR